MLLRTLADSLPFNGIFKIAIAENTPEILGISRDNKGFVDINGQSTAFSDVIQSIYSIIYMDRDAMRAAIFKIANEGHFEEDSNTRLDWADLVELNEDGIAGPRHTGIDIHTGLYVTSRCFDSIITLLSPLQLYVDGITSKWLKIEYVCGDPCTNYDNIYLLKFLQYPDQLRAIDYLHKHGWPKQIDKDTFESADFDNEDFNTFARIMVDFPYATTYSKHILVYYKAINTVVEDLVQVLTAFANRTIDFVDITKKSNTNTQSAAIVLYMMKKAGIITFKEDRFLTKPRLLVEFSSEMLTTLGLLASELVSNVICPFELERKKCTKRIAWDVFPNGKIQMVSQPAEDKDNN